MRLGAWKCEIKPDTLAYKIYGKTTISERHRHRYEFNSDYLAELQKAGLKASGVNPETGLVEIVELEDHPFFIWRAIPPRIQKHRGKPTSNFREFCGCDRKSKEKIMFGNNFV